MTYVVFMIPPYFPLSLSRFVVNFLRRVAQWIPPTQQETPTFPEHMSYIQFLLVFCCCLLCTIIIFRPIVANKRNLVCISIRGYEVHIISILFVIFYVYLCPARVPYQMMSVTSNSNTTSVTRKIEYALPFRST